jgi:putative nucleotidyltransferase with HDIG domain
MPRGIRDDIMSDLTQPAVQASKGESPSLRLFVQVVTGLGLVILAHSIFTAAQMSQPLGWMAFAALAIVTGSFKLNFASVEASISVADTFFISSALLFGPGPAAVAIAIDSFVICWRRRDPLSRLVFNTFAPTLALWFAAQAFFAVAGVKPLADSHAPIGQLVLPLMSLAVIYFVLNSGLTAVVVGLDSRQSPIELWRRHFQWLSVGYCAAASVAFCLILLIQQVSFVAVVVVLPLLAVLHLTLRASFGRLDDARRHLADVDRLYLSTVETLAMAIDAKDDVTHSHVRRVQAYAIGLARALDITDEPTLKAIEAAALLHDTGKLAVPEHILNKPGKLTAAEFEKMKLHVDVGADILSLVEFPYPVVPIVRCHHESWDGSGYPRGVSGEAIPIGARILSVVDCYDALTSDRPYRTSMTDTEAVEILRQRSGNMYDPRVVDAFIRIRAGISLGRADAPAHREVLQRITQTRAETAPGSEAIAEPPSSTPTSLLAFVSLSRVAAGEGGVADVLALGSRLLGDIVPGATGAWYMPNAAHDELAVADAFGPGAGVLRGATVGFGERLTGWVAANRQPIANSAAALDLGARAHAVMPALHSCMSVPLVAGDVVVAVLTLYASAADAFDEDRGRLVQMVAPHLAGAIHAASKASSAILDARPQPEKATGGPLRLVSTR